MTIYDHIIKGGSTELEAISLLPDYGSYDEDEHWHWRGDCVIPDLKIVIAEAVYDMTDPSAPVLVSPEETLAGYWLAIALPSLSEELKALPDDACRLIADRDAAKRGEAFVRYVSPAMNPAHLSARVYPVFAGSNYPFGAVETP